MSKDYLVVTYRAIKYPGALVSYAKLAVPAIESSGGRIIVLA